MIKPTNQEAQALLVQWGEWKTAMKNLKREAENETGCLRRSNKKHRIDFDEPTMMIIDNLFHPKDRNTILTKRQKVVMHYEWVRYISKTQEEKRRIYNKGVLYDWEKENDYDRVLISANCYRLTVFVIKKIVARAVAESNNTNIPINRTFIQKQLIKPNKYEIIGT